MFFIYDDIQMNYGNGNEYDMEYLPSVFMGKGVDFENCQFP